MRKLYGMAKRIMLTNSTILKKPPPQTCENLKLFDKEALFKNND